MKLSCCMLVRDDASTLRACLESIRPHVDELCILDTGSSDDSPRIAQEFADRWERFTECNDAQGRIEDFAMARNRSFELATGDWLCWFDADDIVQNGENLRRVAAASPHRYTRYVMPYEYAHDDTGRVVLLQYRERLMRGDFEWVSPVHEICMPTGADCFDVQDNSVRVIHRQRHSAKVREEGRNLRILRSYIKRVGDGDPRALYYFGTELSKAGDLGGAARAFKRAIELDRWNDQKCRAMLELGFVYARVGFHEDANKWFSEAMFVRNWPEPMLALGRSFYQLARPEEFAETRQLDPQQLYNIRRATQWLFRGIETEPLRDALLYTDPMERARALELLSACTCMLGDVEKTFKVCQWGLEMTPENPTLRHHFEWAKAEKAKSEGQKPAPVRMLAVPSDLRVEPQQPDPGKLDLVFFLGPALEHWSPETWARDGMGGSETMAWELARRLRKRGHRVRMYVNCTPEHEGLYEGVEWLQWQRFRNVRCDVLVASRRPEAVRDSFQYEHGGTVIGGCKATANVLWVHDVHVGAFAQADERRFDRVLCLSEWHAEFFASGYRHLDRSKVHVTRNGIDLNRFVWFTDDGPMVRIPHRAIYSSSPDRGLLAAALAWPRIREQVPDAELHVFYGFGNWEKGCGGDPGQLAAIARLKHLCATTPGVVMRDRVNQAVLAKEFMRAGVWLYPTWFAETSCITAMEAQAAGCWIVTSPIAALTETVRYGEYMLREEWGANLLDPRPEFVAEVAEQTATIMQLRSPLAGFDAHCFGLDSLADDWSEMLMALEAERKLEPVPKFNQPTAEQKLVGMGAGHVV